eukprot:snap_masked-scaffold_10-processed-gene-7.7-mRNA-1 protein AED:1.00 eAED:1.00 QI:0/0/0/0/1/1/3/0/74
MVLRGIIVLIILAKLLLIVPKSLHIPLIYGLFIVANLSSSKNSGMLEKVYVFGRSSLPIFSGRNFLEILSSTNI